MSLLGNATRQGGKIMAIADKHDLLVALRSHCPEKRAVCGLLDLDKGIISFWFADGTAQRYRMEAKEHITIEDYQKFAIKNAGRRYSFGIYNHSILALLHNQTPIGCEL